MTKVLLFVLAFLPALSDIRSQGLDSLDPVRNFRRYDEFGYMLTISEINPSFEGKEMGESGYTHLIKYAPGFEFGSNSAWIWKDKRSSIYIFKSGLSFGLRSIYCQDSLQENYALHTFYARIPFLLGGRLQLRHSQVRGEMYRATELYFGPSVLLPIIEGFENEDGRINTAEYFTFGLQMEVYITSQNKRGYGHRYGLKMILEFASLSVSEPKYGSPPNVATFGVFYNIFNEFD